MKLIVLYGGPATGKYTVGKALSQMSGLPLFHNHLVVDAVMALFPFGSPSFVALREQFWLDAIRAAASEDRSLIFTYQPEPSVTDAFIPRLRDIISRSGGAITWAHLTTPTDLQDQRIDNPDRAKFGKLRDREMLARLRDDFTACEQAMPKPDVQIDTSTSSQQQSAARIAKAAGLI